jgi:hypothetical protein
VYCIVLCCAVQGKLGQLVQLIHSMSFITGGLASIMAAFRPQQDTLNSLAHAASTAADMVVQPGGMLASKQQQQQQWVVAGEAATALSVAAVAAEAEDDVTVDILIECVLAAVEELPVWESTDVEQVCLGGGVDFVLRCTEWLATHNAAQSRGVGWYRLTPYMRMGPAAPVGPCQSYYFACSLST